MVEVNIPARDRLEAIQGLRAVAALLVVVAHTLLSIRQWFPDAPVREIAGPMGEIGVYVFFVISGFIMIHTAGDNFGARGASIEFFRRRLLRIAPLYWLVTGVRAGGKLILGKGMDVPLTVSSLLFFPIVNGSKMQPLIGVGWTLNYEMFFYALFAVALLLPRVPGLIALFTTLIGLTGLGLLLNSPFERPMTPLEFWTAPIILFFAAGMALALVRRRWRVYRIPFAVVPATILLGVAILAHPYWSSSIGGFALFDLCSVAAVALCCLTTGEMKGVAGQTLALLGDASYSIYLAHGFILTAVWRGWNLAFHASSPVAYAVAGILASAVGGVALHLWVEKPVARLLSAGLRPKVRGRQPDPVG